MTISSDALNPISVTLEAGIAVGEVRQMADGRAGVYAGTASVAAGESADFEIEGIYDLPKAAVALLDGGKVYWDHSANVCTFKDGGDRDFFVGTVVGDRTAADGFVKVNLNVEPRYKIDVGRDPFDSVKVGTPVLAAMLQPLGGAHALIFSSDNEAQKVDILSKDGFAVGANAIVEGQVEVVDDGDAAAIDFNIGVANGTDSDDADDITESVFIHTDGNSTTIKAESDDGTTQVAATDTTKTYTLGTRFEFWMDLRDPSDVQIYIEGINVLPGSTFDISAATGPLKLLAHLEKSADATTAEYHIDALRVRTAEQ